MKKYVLFDMDGTLLNTVEDLASAVNHVLEEHSEPQRSIDEIRSFVGNGNRRLMERALLEGEAHPDFEKMLEEFFAYYLLHGSEKTLPYEGIMELLLELERRGIKSAVVTNKFQKSAEELTKLYFGDLIETTVGDGEGRKRKPAADAALCALKRLGAKAEETIYIGDSPVDFETAKNAGIQCVLCSWGFCDKEVLKVFGADIIDHPKELISYFD